jgi:prolyl oligopeptidase
MRSIAIAVSLAVLGAFSLSGAPVWAAPPKKASPSGKVTFPETKKGPVADTYHGTAVTEDYRWLEGADDAVRAWSDAQNAYARSYLDRLSHAPEIKKRVSEILKSRPAEHVFLTYRKTGVFALKIEPPKQQPMLVLLRSADDRSSERVIVDPNKLNPRGTTAIDFYAPSLDGKKVAVSLSENGSEDGTVHEYDVESATEIGEAVPRVNGGTAGGSVAWNADGSGFWYTRYPRNQERPSEDMSFYQQVYFHKLETPTDSDVYAIGKDFPRIAEVELETSDDGRYVLARVANGDGGEFAHYVFDGKAWKRITEFKDKVVHATFGKDGALYLRSLDKAPRGKILRLPLATLDLSKARVIVPESESTINAYQPTETRLYVVGLLGGPSDIRVFDLAGKLDRAVPVQPISDISQILRLEKDEVLFRSTSFVDAPAWFHYSPQDGAAKKTSLFRTAVVDFSDTEVVREMATSKDGTKIPINIVRKKGTRLDGKNPTILYGYGGYSVSLTPSFREDMRIWIEQGGVYAMANLRGGGEFGEDWHRAGNLTKKQNVFDDFIASAEYLIKSGHTRPEKLAILGGSNGGLLMGAALTQHPELFGAVISQVGIYDMLRVELTNNGAFNVTEFGTVKDPEQFKALYAYSPYHHVVDGTSYPATLFMTGANDPRVDPWHSRKMIARLQAASSSKKPILLRTDDAGHGIGTSLDVRIGQIADLYAFAFQALDAKYDPKVGKAQPIKR